MRCCTGSEGYLKCQAGRYEGYGVLPDILTYFVTDKIWHGQ
jgi:hypothetical protein